MDPIAIYTVAGGSLTALVGVLVWLIRAVVRGTFISRTSHEREVGIWKTVVENKDQTISTQAEQITALLEQGKTVQAFLRAAGPPVDEGTYPTKGQ